ncbi:30S ribosomal protein S2 [Bdellovibrio bacteriovorus]|uniref:Small ribosomal subunit protein uS2 n=1 Tax=Bdellovibrio bacteriovorus TaxID=959 RepID=A0A150WWG3_BDEBC|nr:30S ribosomal protein S2 [Bdellovibrio bacteriovorus]KYG68862.1 30S ribosomal protein S2 [Bdellovibrio bacteriovorus]KYG70756.1 30S ribosomal protein S2 [Bdellovibrio bacteriovorus]
MAQVTMKEMLDAGVHFGHQTQRWNPKMKPYVYTARGGIHIIDLQKTVVRANKAADFVKEVAANGGRLIFVGTKKQAIEPIQEAAQKCGQYYVTKRWLGGMMTNFETIKSSIDRLRKIDTMKEKGEFNYLTKKERAKLEKEYLRLTEFLSGIREMKEMPSAMFVVDLPKEHIAVAEAKRLGIPVVAIADTNSDPESVEYAIPGNDDAIRSIKLFANLVAEAYLEGAKTWEQKLRTMTDKQSDVAKEASEGKEEAPKRRGAGPRGGAKDAPKKSAGPAVVKATKGRKLVAAGTAEEVEIQAELENKEDDSAE